jgi:hypothetical protein
MSDMLVIIRVIIRICQNLESEITKNQQQTLWNLIVNPEQQMYEWYKNNRIRPQ